MERDLSTIISIAALLVSAFTAYRGHFAIHRLDLITRAVGDQLFPGRVEKAIIPRSAAEVVNVDAVLRNSGNRTETILSVDWLLSSEKHQAKGRLERAFALKPGEVQIIRFALRSDVLSSMVYNTRIASVTLAMEVAALAPSGDTTILKVVFGSAAPNDQADPSHFLLSLTEKNRVTEILAQGGLRGRWLRRLGTRNRTNV